MLSPSLLLIGAGERLPSDRVQVGHVLEKERQQFAAIVREAGEVEVVVVRERAVREQELDHAAVARTAVGTRDDAPERRPARSRARDHRRFGAGVEQRLRDLE